MTKIKICGIKTLKDAVSAIEAGADYLGFNFYAKSPRYIEKNICAEVTFTLKKEYPHIKLIGVFVNSSVDEIKDILQTCSLDLAQLHGDETLDMLNELKGKAFKAIRLLTDFVADLETDKRMVAGLGTDFVADLETDKRMVADLEPAFLIDAAVKGVYGGSGVKADWDVASELAKQYKFLLAGGLTPENVGEAVSRVKPWGVDVASGVESVIGQKDEAKMKAFIKAVRAVENQKQEES